MSGFCGYIDLKNNILQDKLIKEMTNEMSKKNIENTSIYINKRTTLGFVNKNNEHIQPISKIINNSEYIITFNGELYNKSDIVNELEKIGLQFDTKDDIEVVLLCYAEYGENCVKILNGIFSFVIYDVKNDFIFIARDRLGVKPLFYAITDTAFVFSTNIKGILKYKDVKAILDRNGLMELIGLGPAHTPGKTYFKNIFEIKPGHIAVFRNNKLDIEKYWDVTTKECFDNEDQAIEQIHYLVTDATKKQLSSDNKISSMLSGGLDSSILSKIAKDNDSNLNTYSIDYIGNDKNFAANDYQMTKDSDYIKIMRDYLQTNHKIFEIENTILFDLLDDSMIARNMPGMADIDSSMFAFCSEIKKDGCNMCISGECSDEIFGGYPWYYKEHLITHDGFPWALSENLRNNILKKGILKKNELNEYIDASRKDTLKNVEHLDNEDSYERRFRDINYLTIKWFMNTLIERTERISNVNSLDVRIPFADYRIFEYVYNLPAKMKLGLSKSSLPVEKYLLRKAFENELPEDIVYRKKSPFPKTYDPVYLRLVENKTHEILSNKKSKLFSIINYDFVEQMLNIHGENLTENWFGQLMTYPQTLAYLIQIEKWLEIYDIELDI